jgi:hypothetical protein
MEDPTVAAARQGRIKVMTASEGRSFLEQQVRDTCHIGLDEFVQRWQAGDYGDFDDDPRALRLAMLLPIIGIDPWSDRALTAISA